VSNCGHYQRYLTSPHWQQARAAALHRAGRRCEATRPATGNRCEATVGLRVHHVAYSQLGHERPENLMVLCDSCHRRAHGLAEPDWDDVGVGQEITP
jgi:5-methylcytosine-specific restriction endonuclease McrA